MQIVWSQPAYDSFSDVLYYTEETFGKKQAKIIENSIFDLVNRLAVFPMSCPIIPEISNDIREYRKLVVNKELSVIYRIDDDNIYIMFVWDVRRSLHNVYNYFNGIS